VNDHAKDCFRRAEIMQVTSHPETRRISAE